MTISIHRIRRLLSSITEAKAWPVVAAAITLWVGGIWLVSQSPAQSAIDLSKESRIANVAVSNSAFTNFTNPLEGANFIQITLNASDAQVFTYCPPQGGDCAEIPSGQGFQIGTLRKEIRYGQSLGSVETSTDAATLQIVAQRVQ